jgi:hypothetical protein
VYLSTLSRATQRLRQRTPEQPGQAGRTGLRGLPAPDSLWWLALAAAAFTAVQLAFVVPHLGLSWDETVYVSQVGGHGPAAFFDPARARGVPLLAAPVALLTSSVTVLHAYLGVASGLGLFLALLTWRRLRPAWTLALAAVVFGGLWTAQYYGPQAMPDLWVALSAVSAVGFFLQAAQRLSAGRGDPDVAAAQDVAAGQAVPAGQDGPAGPQRARGALAGLAVTMALAALFRPGDAVFLTATLLLAVVVARRWRRWPLAIAVAAGAAAGGAEWAVEAYVRFGGVLRRLHEAGAEQGGFGLHLAVWDELKALNGPTLCRPCLVGWRQPELSLWWLALPVLVALGIVAARRAGRLDSAVLPAACALGIAIQYLFLINYAAPRFLLPAYALLAIPVADALGWLVSRARPRLRPLVATGVVCGLALQLTAQHVVLDHEVRGTIVFHRDYARIAADLARLGLRPPCLIKGEQYIPIAYLAGCASAGQPATFGHPGRVAVLEYAGVQPPGFAAGWHRHDLPGTRVLKLVAYLPRG